MTMRLSLILGLSVLLPGSCAIRAKKWIDKKIIPDTYAYNLTVNNQQAHDSIRVLYTGCGGLVIFKGKEGIMTDPYYTGHRWWNLGHIKIDPENDAKVIERIDAMGPAKNITAVMISHSHYDHLQDLPYLLDKNTLNDKLKIIGDSSTNCTLSPFLKPAHTFIYSDHVASSQKKPPVQWIQTSEHIRILVIRSDHAPHYRKIHKMTGNTCYHKQPLKQATGKSKAKHWLEGKSFSFLVDIMNETNTKPVLRMYIQGSSCTAPNGFPPKDVLDEKKVDVAFLGVASSTWVQPYPKDILNWLNPEKIVLIHWEDFFRDFYKETQKSVRLTKINRFMDSLRVQYKYSDVSELSERFSMPKPLTEITIGY